MYKLGHLPLKTKKKGLHKWTEMTSISRFLEESYQRSYYNLLEQIEDTEDGKWSQVSEKLFMISKNASPKEMYCMPSYL